MNFMTHYPNRSEPAMNQYRSPNFINHAAADQFDHGPTGDPIQDFDAAVRQRMPRGRQASYSERLDAVCYVARTNPRLHIAYLKATQTGGPRVQRQIDEKAGS